MNVVDKELQYCRCCCCLLWRCALTQSALKGDGTGLNVDTGTLSDQLAFDLETVNSEKGNWKGEPKHFSGYIFHYVQNRVYI